VRIPFARLTLAALVLHSTPALAGEVVLDLEAALARASESPAAIAARGRAAAADGLRRGAGALSNPDVEVEAGPRFAGDTTVDVAVRVGQGLDLGRGARADAAAADASLARAEADATLAETRRAVADAFYGALHAERVVALERHGEELARAAASAAERRRRAGDITDLDVGLGRAALGRARAAVLAADGERIAALGELAVLLGLGADDRIVLRGELTAPAGGRGDVAARPDVRAAAAEEASARAELRVARRQGRPDLGLWLGYQREEDATIALAGLRVTLPVWQRGQGATAAARARLTSAATLAQSSRRTASRQAADAAAAAASAVAAVAAFEAEVLPALDESERLLARTADTGVIAVTDYLVVRRELLDGRREYLDRQLAAARAEVAARFAAGGLR
jgi:outer membrane protein, heavy metal efflux system